MVDYTFLISLIGVVIGALMIIFGRKKKIIWIPGLILVVAGGIMSFFYIRMFYQGIWDSQKNQQSQVSGGLTTYNKPYVYY